MALIQCPECGKQVSDKAEACPNCGCPLAIDVAQVSVQQTGMECPKCHGHNIQVSMESVAEKKKGRAEVRKKSIVTRTGNKIGRASMIVATGGIWALTPKKSNYSEKRKGKDKIVNKTFAVCQDCGCSWEIKDKGRKFGLF